MFFLAIIQTWCENALIGWRANNTTVLHKYFTLNVTNLITHTIHLCTHPNIRSIHMLHWCVNLQYIAGWVPGFVSAMDTNDLEMTGKTVSLGSVGCRWTDSFHVNATLVWQLEKWPSTDLISGLISSGAHVSWYYPAQPTTVVMCLTSCCTTLHLTLSSDPQLCQDIEMGIVFHREEEECTIMNSYVLTHDVCVCSVLLNKTGYLHKWFWWRKYHGYVMLKNFFGCVYLVDPRELHSFK